MFITRENNKKLTDRQREEGEREEKRWGVWKEWQPLDPHFGGCGTILITISFECGRRAEFTHFTPTHKLSC